MKNRKRLLTTFDTFGYSQYLLHELKKSVLHLNFQNKRAECIENVTKKKNPWVN